jgi:hypothetical protein
MIGWLDIALGVLILIGVGYIAWTMRQMLRLVTDLAMSTAYLRELANRHDAEILDLKQRK